MYVYEIDTCLYFSFLALNSFILMIRFFSLSVLLFVLHVAVINRVLCSAHLL